MTKKQRQQVLACWLAGLDEVEMLTMVFGFPNAFSAVALGVYLSLNARMHHFLDNNQLNREYP
jgi:hypothetical protein